MYKTCWTYGKEVTFVYHTENKHLKNVTSMRYNRLIVLKTNQILRFLYICSNEICKSKCF